MGAYFAGVPVRGFVYLNSGISNYKPKVEPISITRRITTWMHRSIIR